jgi:hypothetical protein
MLCEQQLVMRGEKLGEGREVDWVRAGREVG